MSDFSYEIGSDNIAIIKWDVPNKKFNVLTIEGIDEIEKILDELFENNDLKGVIITSNKDNFSAGMDLNVLAHLQDQSKNKEEIFQFVMRAHKFLRKIELGGTDTNIKKTAIPFVWACNGLSAGIATEIGLACHHRIAADIKNTKIGLPEILVGLFPGAGGATRVSRMLGLMASAPILMEGRMFSAKKAKAIGLINEVSSPLDLIEHAKKWILNATKEDITKPWDKKGFKVPGGFDPNTKGTIQMFSVVNAMVAKNTNHNYPAPISIVSSVYEGCLLPIDKGLEIEAKYFVGLLMDPVSGNMIRSLFNNKQSADKLRARPDGVEKHTVKTLGMLGAGMMGAGIALVSARAGMKVYLLDSSLESAEKGKAYSEKYFQKSVARKKMTEEKKAAILDNIIPTIDYSDLKDCDLIIEAVFENREIKADVTQKTEAVIGEDIVFASNTSTLPISGLAESSGRPHNFIGMHFFSPVERMPLVEMIMGEQSSDEALAKSLDYIAQIKKTPIVVNDSRGFYTSRVFSTSCNEANEMIKEGVNPALIENAARHAGYPVGPIAVQDETTIDLSIKIHNQSQ